MNRQFLFEEYERQYPIREIEALPVIFDGPFRNRWDAETCQENIEIANEIGGLEVVKFNEQFYVINRE